MSLLSVCQAVSRVVGLNVPTVIATSNEREYVELFEFAQEMAKRIARGHNWQQISRTHKIVGDGTTVSHDFPDDYDRMLVKAQVWSSSLETALTHIPDLDRWLELEVQTFDFVINAWTIFGDQMHFKPALETGVEAEYFYQMDTIIRDQDGSSKKEFTADTDEFKLDDQLLKLGIIWQWRESKGLPYAEDLQNFEELKSRLVVRDKGSRIARVGRVRYPHDVTIAYPRTVEGANS